MIPGREHDERASVNDVLMEGNTNAELIAHENKIVAARTDADGVEINIVSKTREDDRKQKKYVYVFC